MAKSDKGPYVLAWDLGTGGNKASLYSAYGDCLAACFTPYNTTYPAPGWHEQRPRDWWHAVVESTRHLIQETRVNANGIECCGIMAIVGGDSRSPLWRRICADVYGVPVVKTSVDQQAAALGAAAVAAVGVGRWKDFRTVDVNLETNHAKLCAGPRSGHNRQQGEPL